MATDSSFVNSRLPISMRCSTVVFHTGHMIAFITVSMRPQQQVSQLVRCHCSEKPLYTEPALTGGDFHSPQEDVSVLAFAAWPQERNSIHQFGRGVSVGNDAQYKFIRSRNVMTHRRLGTVHQRSEFQMRRISA